MNPITEELNLLVLSKRWCYNLVYNKCLFICFLGVTTHCGCIFHSPVAGFSLLILEVS